MIANAGVSGEPPARELSWSRCAQVIAVNVAGAVATLTGALPGMVSRGTGHLVGISSVAQYRGLPRSATYCASKAFLSTFLEGIRIELQPLGVAVTDVRPGYVDTPMTAKLSKKPFEVDADEAARRILRAVARRRGVFTFPGAMAVLGPVLGAVPRGVYEPVMRAQLRKR